MKLQQYYNSKTKEKKMLLFHLLKKEKLLQAFRLLKQFLPRFVPVVSSELQFSSCSIV